jgi:hypothetical protein
MILVNDKLEIVYDDEDFIGRHERMMEAFKKQGLFEPIELPKFTREDYAEMKKGPCLVIDSLGAM